MCVFFYVIMENYSVMFLLHTLCEDATDADGICLLPGRKNEKNEKFSEMKHKTW